MKVKVTNEGLLIPKAVAERLGSAEVEVFEAPGRLVFVAGTMSPHGAERRLGVKGDDPILTIGRNRVRTGAQDGSTHHDAYLHGANG